jgi:hypothetical protein
MQSWTPYFLQEGTIKPEGSRWSVLRKQFPLIESEALTIFKTQGQSYAKIAVCITPVVGASKQTDLYVALSRVTSLDGLFLFDINDNIESITQGKKWESWTQAQRKAAIKESREKSVVKKELARMHNEAAFTNTFPFLNNDEATEEFNRHNSTTLIYHNVAGLQCHIDNINADLAHCEADILCLGECHTGSPLDQNANSKIQIKDYSLLHLTGCTKAGAKHGIALYASLNSVASCLNCKSNADMQEGLYTANDVLEIAIFYNKDCDVHICYLYNHPTNTINSFWNQFFSFLTTRLNYNQTEKKFNEDLIVVGDFNIVWEDETKSGVWSKFTKYLGLKYQLVDGPTTDRDTTIDLCFTNIDDHKRRIKVIRYESLFSDHKPLYIYIKHSNQSIGQSATMLSTEYTKIYDTLYGVEHCLKQANSYASVDDFETQMECMLINLEAKIAQVQKEAIQQLLQKHLTTLQKKLQKIINKKSKK